MYGGWPASLLESTFAREIWESKNGILSFSLSDTHAFAPVQSWSFIEGRSSAFHLFQDIRGLGCPDKRFGFLVALLDGNHDRGDEFFNAVKHASADAVVGEISKKTFHHVEPGSAGRCEVHVEARMALEPALHSRVLVRRVVVSN